MSFHNGSLLVPQGYNLLFLILWNHHVLALMSGITFSLRIHKGPDMTSPRISVINQQPSSSRSVCKVNTQDPENFDEELKSLVTAWSMIAVAVTSLRTALLSPRNGFLSIAQPAKP